MGKITKHSINEAINAKVTAIGICAKKSPVAPVIINIGKKAATVVKVEEITGSPTSAVPVTIA